MTTQYLHTQNVTTRRRCGRNDNQDSPRDLSAHRAHGIAADEVESKVSGAARRGRRGLEVAVGGGCSLQEDARKGGLGASGGGRGGHVSRNVVPPAVLDRHNERVVAEYVRPPWMAGRNVPAGYPSALRSLAASRCPWAALR